MLTSPAVVSLQPLPEGWSVGSLLDLVATAEPPYHALIDSGALITGWSNLGVAEQLLSRGLPRMHGVVFLDAADRQMMSARRCRSRGLWGIAPLG